MAMSVEAEHQLEADLVRKEGLEQELLEINSKLELAEAENLAESEVAKLEERKHQILKTLDTIKKVGDMT